MVKENSEKKTRFKYKTGLVLGLTTKDRLRKAIEMAVEYDDLSPLCMEVKTGNPHITDEEFRYFIADRIAGKPLRKPGEKPRKKTADQKKLKILMEVSKLVAIGMAAFSNENMKGETACSLVAKNFHLSPSTIRDYWKSRIEFYKSVRLSYFDVIEIQLTRKIFLMAGEPPKSCFILDLLSAAEMQELIYCYRHPLEPDCVDRLNKKVSQEMKDIFGFPALETTSLCLGE